MKAIAFYLSDDQCAEVNALAQDHWERRRAAGATIWFEEPALVPDPLMSDEYLTDDETVDVEVVLASRGPVREGRDIQAEVMPQSGSDR